MNIKDTLLVCVCDYMVTKVGLVISYIIYVSKHYLSETDKFLWPS